MKGPDWLKRLALDSAQQLSVDVQELHWLARSLELRVRCTVDAEALMGEAYAGQGAAVQRSTVQSSAEVVTLLRNP